MRFTVSKSNVRYRSRRSPTAAMCLAVRQFFLGDGVSVYAGKLAALLNVPYSFAPAHRRLQSAAAVGVYASVLYRQGVWESAREHRPEYLRLSQAERERLEKERQR